MFNSLCLMAGPPSKVHLWCWRICTRRTSSSRCLCSDHLKPILPVIGQTLQTINYPVPHFTALLWVLEIRQIALQLHRQFYVVFHVLSSSRTKLSSISSRVPGLWSTTAKRFWKFPWHSSLWTATTDLKRMVSGTEEEATRFLCFSNTKLYYRYKCFQRKITLQVILFLERRCCTLL